MTEAEKQYWEAFNRIKKTKKPSRANVALEAGKDPSSIKQDRFPDLCEAIQSTAKSWSKKGKSREAKIIEKLKINIKELETQRNEAYNRELMLIAKIRKLELELIDIKKNSLNSLSANMIDFREV